jgi:hypothetical protein
LKYNGFGVDDDVDSILYVTEMISDYLETAICNEFRKRKANIKEVLRREIQGLKV